MKSREQRKAEPGLPPRTVGEAVRRMEDDLSARGVESPVVVARFLMAGVLGCRPLEVYLRAETRLPAEAWRRGLEWTHRAAAGEPVQYILGETEFFGRVFEVTPAVLIPRPETEFLVSLVLEEAGLWDREETVVADLGTGSGCIAVTLACERPRVRCRAVDLSEAALAVAARNAARHGVADRVVFLRGDLLEGVGERRLDVVVANLPYVPTRAWERLAPAVRRHEPRGALDGGDDGLSTVRRLIERLAARREEVDRAFLEIDPCQAERVVDGLRNAGFRDIDVLNDLCGRPRVVRSRFRL